MTTIAGNLIFAIAIGIRASRIIAVEAFDATPSVAQPPEDYLLVEQLLTFTHALSQIAAQNCSGKVDVADLDAFQSFINSQLRHTYIRNPWKVLPRDYEAIMKNIITCSNFHFDPQQTLALSSFPASSATGNDPENPYIKTEEKPKNSTGIRNFFRKIANRTAVITKTAALALSKSWGSFKAWITGKKSQSSSIQEVPITGDEPFYSMIQLPSEYYINAGKERPLLLPPGVMVYNSYTHFLKVFKTMTTIASETCEETDNAGGIQLKKIGETIGNILQGRLQSLKKAGLVVKINKQLENDLKSCTQHV